MKTEDLVLAAPPLSRAFFERDPREVAPALLGKLLLVRRLRGEVLAGRIVETEAYLGADDAAAHSAAGRTARNDVLFGPPGHAYVYFIYGAYYCLNVSCEPEGKAGCVLLRGLEPLAGIATMVRNRGLAAPATASMAKLRALTSGPGRLCDALDITRERDNGKDMLSPKSDLLLLEGDAPARIETSPRVGITKAAEAHLRYAIAGSPFVSKPPKAFGR